MTDTLRKSQHGGNHYASLAIRPTDFCTANAYDPAAFEVNKYVTRHALKHAEKGTGKEDLLKSQHFVLIRRHLQRQFGPLRLGAQTIPVEEYIQSNRIMPLEAGILTLLDRWIMGETVRAGMDDDATALQLASMHDQLIDLHYD